MRACGKYTGLVESKLDVLNKPYNVLLHYPNVCPLDFVLQTNEGMFGIDLTIISTGLFAKQPRNQEQQITTLHRSREKEKWRGISQTNEFQEGKQQDNNSDATIRTEEVPGSEIMQHLLDAEVQMMPGIIDAHMHEGLALKWFCHGCHNQSFDLMEYNNFRIQDGNMQGWQMCHTTMSDDCFCSVYCKANKKWLKKHKNKHFGPTYQDTMPKSWADTFITC
eukprot:8615898-Ditylum_brightwellii.AAC.1